MLEALLDEVLDQSGLAISTERAGRQEAARTREIEELSGELWGGRNRLGSTLAFLYGLE